MSKNKIPSAPTRRDFTRYSLAAVGALAMPFVRPAAAQGANIPLGMVLPFSGATGAYGPDMEKAARMVVAQINDGGGILGGRMLDLFIEDSESNPTAGVAATRKLLEVNDVEMIGGFWGSPIALATQPILLDAGKVQMVSGAANAITEGDTRGLVWRFQAKSTQWGPAGATIMDSLGAKRVTVLAQQNPFVNAMIEPFKAEMEAVGGTVEKVIVYNPDQPSYRAEVEQAFGDNPDGVFCLSLLTDFTSIAKEIYRGGFESKVVTLSIAGDAEGRFLANVDADVAEGIHHLQPAPPFESDAYKSFVSRMGAPEGSIFLFAGNAHDQLCVTALAMEKAGSTDPALWSKAIPEIANPPGIETADILEALELVRAGEEINFIGAGATCDFDEKGDQLNRSFLHQVIENGANRIVGTLS